MSFEDETISFWLAKPLQLLAETAAVLHKDRREYLTKAGPAEVEATRRGVAYLVLAGNGVEVGAGDRPWPLPPQATCFYGDIRDAEKLITYFTTPPIPIDCALDAQTFEGVADGALDFVISAHVIEHLQDPLGSILATMRVLRSGGVALFAVPDMRHTFDRDRPPVTLAHLQADALDGGVSSRAAAYLEDVRYVFPIVSGQPRMLADEEIRHAERNDALGKDIHFHAWTGDTFKEHLLAIAEKHFRLEGHVPVRNENIYILRKL